MNFMCILYAIALTTTAITKAHQMHRVQIVPQPPEIQQYTAPASPPHTLTQVHTQSRLLPLNLAMLTTETNTTDLSFQVLVQQENKRFDK